MVVFLEARSRRRTFQVFIKEALPKAGESARTLVAFLIETSIGATGSSLSESHEAPAEITACADGFHRRLFWPRSSLLIFTLLVTKSFVCAI
jgi:hypothetical protein